MENHIAELNKKAAQLAKRYPNLKVQANVKDERIYISTKYGAGAWLDAYVYKTLKGVWAFTGERVNLRIDDIDAKGGKAILRAINAH